MAELQPNDVRYIRLTNLDDANPILVRLNGVDSGETPALYEAIAEIELAAGGSFVLYGGENFDASGDTHGPTGTPGAVGIGNAPVVGDLASIALINRIGNGLAAANAADVDVEVFIAQV